jgi:alpha-glucosidase (family GH31 glycosyl hydrolase)
VLACACGTPTRLQAVESVVTGAVRIQPLSSSLVRLELKGSSGFEDRQTFHVRNRDWAGAAFTSNLVSGEVVVTTAGYAVHVPRGASSLSGSYVVSPAGQVLYRFDGVLTNSVWLPGPATQPTVLSFADTPRLARPAWGATPAPAGAQPATTSGWDTANDAADVYVFLPNGSYSQLRKDFLRLTGPCEMVPLYALGLFDSRWEDYSEADALAQIDSYRAHHVPLDVLVCDTGWRQNASTGYQPNTDLFPNLPRFFAEAHAKNVRVMFNDHPEPVASTALDPLELTYRYTNLTQLLGQGLDVWWYDRNWGVSLRSPADGLRHEVWGMEVYADATRTTNALQRPMIMANIDGIDNGVRNRPPNVSTHRYSIQWTGDIQPSMKYLDYAVKNAVHAGVSSLFAYESDDLGGHVSDPSPADYIRWIEYGALSPIYRPHCTHHLSRMPWSFGAESEWVARRFINLRYRLLPLFYASARDNYDTGEPILRRLDLDYPQYPEANQNGQYLLGHSLLVAPVTHGGLAVVPASWLTTTNGLPGLQASYFDNTNLTGTPVLTQVDTNIDFNWTANGFPASVPTTDFSARWEGRMSIPATAGDLTLAARSDDGVRVWLDGALCLGNWGPNDASATESTVVLKAGKSYALRVEYLQLGGKALFSLRWRPSSVSQQVWIPPGTWINAWTGNLVKGPVAITESTPLDRIPMFIRSGSLFAHAPEMDFTGQRPWDSMMLDIYPSTTETDQTSIYEDDTQTVAYKQGAFRRTFVSTWADDAKKTVSVSIGAAEGGFSGAIGQRSWTVRLRRPPGWSADQTPTQVTWNGQSIGPVVRWVKNVTAMPLGAEEGAPDADVFEVRIPAVSVASTNLIVASFSSQSSPWVCGDIGAAGANGNVFGGGTLGTNSVFAVRGAGAGIGLTNDGFQFVSRPMTGDGQVTVRLIKQTSAHAGAMSGLLLRESLEPSARQAVLAMSVDNGLIAMGRTTAGGASLKTVAPGFAAPCWLRLVRKGNVVSSYASSDNVTWKPIDSVTLAGLGSVAYVGLGVTAGIGTEAEVAGSNNFGTPVVGAAPELSGGVFRVDNTNFNVACFDSLSLNSSVSISTVPNQAAGFSMPVSPVPFTVATTGGGSVTVTAQSSNTNLLTAQNITFSGTGTARMLSLAPTAGRCGSSTVTLIASDGQASASTQFDLTVLPYAGLLMSEDFTNYTPGNLPGQAYRGKGFAASGVWSGINLGFNASVPDAAVVASSGLSWGAVQSGQITVKGNGSNLKGVPDLSSNGLLAAAGLVDVEGQTVGGGSVSGTLYLSCLLRAHFTSGRLAYGGLHLSRGDDRAGFLFGNSWAAWGYSLYYAPSDTSVDLNAYEGGSGYLVVDTNVHLLVARIVYSPGDDDQVTCWLDPNLAASEDNQNSPATYVGSYAGDASFNCLLLRGGNANQFDYGALRLGTTWGSVMPGEVKVPTQRPAIMGAAMGSGRIFRLTFGGLPAQSYTIRTTTNLAVPFSGWGVATGGTIGFDPVTYADAQVTDCPQRFYCVTSP